jgi:hypothetical protein
MDGTQLETVIVTTAKGDNIVTLTPEAQELLKQQRKAEYQELARQRREAAKIAAKEKNRARGNRNYRNRMKYNAYHRKYYHAHLTPEQLAAREAREQAREAKKLARKKDKQRKAHNAHERARYWRNKAAAKRAKAETEAAAKAAVLAERAAKREAQRAKREAKEARFLKQKRVVALLAKTEQRRALIWAQGFREGQAAKQAEYVSRGFPAL